MTVAIRYSREIEERELLRHLPHHVYRQGVDRALFVNVRDRSDADLLVVNMNLHPGVQARIVEESKVG